MSYRGPQRNRMQHQSQHIRQTMGHAVTWRKYITAYGGNDVAGLGASAHYDEKTITAVMSFGRDNREPTHQSQLAIGQVFAGEVYAVTREQIGAEDELVWNGVTYRVESDPIPTLMGNQWNTRLKRGE